MHTCNIIYNDCNRGVPNVTWDQTPEPFLSCSIPERKKKKEKKQTISHCQIIDFDLMFQNMRLYKNIENNFHNSIHIKGLGN